MSYKPLAIEDYGLIGDCASCALVGRNGSIDWLCWPRFDSAACLAALVGTDQNGRWLLAPADSGARTERRYLDDGLVLETVFETDQGSVALIDFMPIDVAAPTIIRVIEGRRGAVDMTMNLRLRFDYGTSVPWVTRLPDDGGITFIAGPALAVLRTTVPLEGEDFATVSRFTVAAGERVSFVMTYGPSHLPVPAALDVDSELTRTKRFWSDWTGRSAIEGPYADAMKRSLVTLKALTYAATGGIVAAPTTSLPEQVGGPRNWDYRYCWLRDATLTLIALMRGGYDQEARDWRDWLHRSIAGSPEQLQIMYGIAGERQLMEWEVPWLDGYENSQPVRVGNAAAGQLQLDVYGEVVAALYLARRQNLRQPSHGWSLQVGLVEHLEQIWREPDEGMWEVRGGRQHFTVSKAFCWMAFDRSIRDVEEYDLPGPVERWRQVRDEIRDTVLREGFNQEKNSFTQIFNGRALDASLLLLPTIGFLPADDPRMLGTVAAIEKELVADGFVLRYRTDDEVDGNLDGLPGNEGAFLACTFWLADVYVQQGRMDEARALFERLLGLRNDLGLLAEEYDPRLNRQVGNFPQAFSHLALFATATHLNDRNVPLRGEADGTAEHKAA
ncbi:glycoside hydrolase family 15 protein [Rhizosaccharibacter radicis]|uniref:Glycoside hydrolase family 15 protein n=1 Tax=Rhizosaccharibacter radicis TaxID=2782605 RepID=A0ABT1VYG6_9PROT|nr:glycoside hydrolase family 15 protein [Acetobacteraceae bacterium KSS12]